MAQIALTEPLGEVLDTSWVDRSAELARSYAEAQPFPHVVIDNFLKPELAEFLCDRFPSMEEMPTVFNEPMSYKGQLSDVKKHRPEFTGVVEALQSRTFRRLMSDVCGIADLIDDPALAGGGLHQSPSSGFLDIHADANYHPFDKTLHRRLNLLIYLNRDWQEAYGGQLELWSDRGRKPGKCVKSVVPAFNRAVLFSTTRTSWHGVAPIACPDGAARRSLAFYYYTHGRPEQELYRDSTVIWHNRSSFLKRALYPVMNAGFALVYPFAKHLRRLRGDVFDAVEDGESWSRSEAKSAESGDNRNS